MVFDGGGLIQAAVGSGWGSGRRPLKRFGVARNAAQSLGLAMLVAVRRYVAEARVSVHRVVPSEEGLAVSPGVLDAAQARREVQPVLQRFELRLRVRVIVRDIGPAVALGDVQIDQQCSRRFGAHAGAAVGVQREHAGLDIVTSHRVGDELLGQFCVLAIGDQPAHHQSAEDVRDHLEVEARPLGRSLEFGDVPRPDLAGRDGQQLGLGVGRVDELIAAFARTAVGSQHTVHGAH